MMNKKSIKLEPKNEKIFDLTFRRLREILSTGNPQDLMSNPYSRLMSSYDISPRAMITLQSLALKVTEIANILEEVRKKLLQKYAKKDENNKPILIPPREEVTRRLKIHLEEARKNTVVDLSAEKLRAEELQKEIEKNIPRTLWKYNFEPSKEQEFNEAFQKSLDEKIKLDGGRPIIYDTDLPKQTDQDNTKMPFLNTFEMVLLSPLIDFRIEE